jgi:hypothetical protein
MSIGIFKTVGAAGAFLAIAMLSGCAGTATNAEIQALISDVQAATVKACGFLPEEQAVESIIAASVPSLQGPQAIADAICASLSTTASAKLDHKKRLTVNGLPVLVLNGVPTVIHGTMVPAK